MDKNKKNKNYNKEDNKNNDTKEALPAFIGLNKSAKEDDVISDDKNIIELLKKNLKWSQIIYEQNRKIGRRLLLSTIVVWLKLAVFIIIFVLGAFYALPFMKNLPYQYGLITNLLSGQDIDSSVLENVLKTIPLSESQLEKIKAMNK